MAVDASVLQGRYRLDRLVGRGGFAQVYLATDLLLKRRVAVKMLLPGRVALDQEYDFLARFDREAQAVAALDHPNILGVHDYGQADGAAYLVMPYIAGGSLDDRLRRERRLSLQQTDTYLRQAAAALDFAHRRNLIHRDIKPQNMLLHPEGDRLLLADFGIAKVLSETSAQSLTGVMGTPAYMAPEQTRGQVGRATDIYALGCVLFQMLTGEPPYAGPTEQVLFGHVWGPVPSLVERSQGQLPAALQAVLDRALAKSPDDRFPTAGALADAFAATIAGPATAAWPPHLVAPTRPLAGAPPEPAPVPAARDRTPPPSPGRPAPPPAARRKVALLAGLGAVLAVLLLAALALGALVVARSVLAARPGAAPAATLVAGGDRPVRAAAALGGHGEPVTRLAWSPDGRTLASASDDRTVRLWDQDGAQRAVLTAHAGKVLALAWSPAGTLATGSADGTVRLWTAEGAPLANLIGHDAGVTTLAWSPDGRILASSAYDLRLWTAEGGTLARLKDAPAIVNALAWSPDGAVLAAGGSDKAVRLWNRDGTARATLTGHSESITSLAWSPDGRLLASGSGDKTARLWNPDGQALADLTGHEGVVRQVAWSPDGQTLATASDDKTVRLWGPDGRQRVNLAGHTGRVLALAWAPDGQTLASASADETVRQWTAAGEPLATLIEHDGYVVDVAWSRGRILASCAQDKTVRLWR